ncbi:MULTISPECIES: MFS transporter [unclassified Streptomyces]|uniref:MFS transporter n=1 Tax=unclassified Streptomyces TaxID=2593676 RepID=UPI0035DC2DD4
MTTVQWVSTAYLLAIAMVIPATGRLAERFGTRAMWMFSLSAFLAGSVLCGDRLVDGKPDRRSRPSKASAAA